MKGRLNGSSGDKTITGMQNQRTVCLVVYISLAKSVALSELTRTDSLYLNIHTQKLFADSSLKSVKMVQFSRPPDHLERWPGVQLSPVI